MQPKAVIQPKEQPVEVKAQVMTQVFDAPKVDIKTNDPKRPKEDVKVGNLNTGNATPATVKAPVEQVQTGGFGGPSGPKGKGEPNQRENVVWAGVARISGWPRERNP